MQLLIFADVFWDGAGRSHFLEILEVPLEFRQCLFPGPPPVLQVLQIVFR